MKFTRVKTTLMAGVMAASMLAPGMTAFADEITAQSGLTFKKNVEVADGVTIPETTITFKAAQVDADGVKTGKQNADGTTQPKTVSDVTLSFSTTALQSVTGSTNKTYSKNFTELETALKNADNTVDNGEYTFQLTETSTDDLDSDGYGWDMNTSNDSYYLHVYVTDGDDGAKVYQYLVTTSNEAEKDDNGKVTKLKDKVGSDNFSFTNKYTKKGGSEPSVDPDDPDGGDETPEGSLVISKSVDGKKEYANDFTFTITFTGSTTETIDATTEYAYTIGSTEGKWTTTNNTVTLKDGEKVVFSNIPAGVTVQVVESANPNVTNTKIRSRFNGASSYTEVAKSTDNTVSGVIGEKANTIAFTNTYNEDITVTGVVTNVTPYITLVVFACAAVAAYVVMKRRVAR